ncbi:MAG: substrate-binding periplasmic protein [Noviherbaspirillum sp.]
MTASLRCALGALALSALAFLAQSAFAEETLKAYNTYRAVPYVAGNGGLAADLVAYLNARLAGRYRLVLSVLPRERLNRTLAIDPDFKDVVLFVNPFFMNDAERTRYYWTPPFMSDANEVISTTANRIEYKGPDSLKGLTFGGILGHRYAGLEDRFGKDIQRENVNEEKSNLRKLAAGRIDVTIIESTTYRYLRKQLDVENNWGGDLYVSSRPHSRFDRFMFVSRNNAALGKELDAIIARMKTDPAWHAILQKYGLD